MKDLLQADENLRAAMRFFAGATGTGDLKEFDASMAIHSGLDYGVFNIALLTRPLKNGGMQAQLEQCAHYYQERSSRWSFWLCEEFLDARARRECHHMFHRLNLREISRAPVMVTPALKPVSRRLPSVEFVPVKDATARDAFGELTAICFDIPFQVAKSVYSPEGAWQGSYQGFVGLVHGKAVCIVATVVAGGVVGIYSLGVLPEWRKRGYGEAILRAALSMCPKGMPIVLESTEAGYPLYKRLGFKDVGHFTVYLTK